MRVAVASDGFNVARRFDFAESFTFYTVDRGIITACQSIPNPRMAPEKMVATMKDLGVGVLICGLINIDEARAYCSQSIEVIAGASGDVKQVVTDYLSKTLIGVDEMCDDEFEGGSCCL